MRWVVVDDTTWPVDVENSVQHALRYRTSGYTNLLIGAASVMSAYAYLTNPDLTQRDAIEALKRARRARKDAT